MTPWDYHCVVCMVCLTRQHSKIKAMTRQVLDNWSSNTDESGGYLTPSPTCVCGRVGRILYTEGHDGHSMPDTHSCMYVYLPPTQKFKAGTPSYVCSVSGG